MFDTTRIIKVYDPNFDQRHTFELLYEPTTGILRDPCYPEAGNWDEITSRAKTPRWLKIDPETGRLYGIPRVEDAPRLGANADTITVLVTDEYGLTHVKQIPIEVQMVNHPPALYRDPLVECVDVGEQYTEEITLTDLDLKRTFPDDAVEEITLSVTQPSGFTVEPATVTQKKLILSAQFASRMQRGLIKFLSGEPLSMQQRVKMRIWVVLENWIPITVNLRFRRFRQLISLMLGG